MAVRDSPRLDPVLNVLSSGELKIINLGLSQFAETLDALGVKVVHVDWHPPTRGSELTDILTALSR